MKMSCCSYMVNLYHKLSNMTKGCVGSALVPAWLGTAVNWINSRKQPHKGGWAPWLRSCVKVPDPPAKASTALGLGAPFFKAVAYPLQCCVDRHSDILINKARESSRECKGRRSWCWGKRGRWWTQEAQLSQKLREATGQMPEYLLFLLLFLWLPLA